MRKIKIVILDEDSGQSFEAESTIDNVNELYNKHEQSGLHEMAHKCNDELNKSLNELEELDLPRI